MTCDNGPEFSSGPGFSIVDLTNSGPANSGPDFCIVDLTNSGPVNSGPVPIVVLPLGPLMQISPDFFLRFWEI